MKKIVIICSVVLLAGLALYRYGGLSATFERGAEEALIKDSAEKCKSMCPTKSDWGNYCNQKEQQCFQDAELARLEGYSEDDVQKLKKECSDQKAKDLASYTNKADCEAACKKRMEEELEKLKQHK